jgi:F-type H+-transporting ATPase subunit a
MESIGSREVLHYVPFTSIMWPLGGINTLTVLNTILVMAVLWTLLYLGARRFAWIPSRGQLTVELILDAFDSLVSSAMELGKTAERHYLPLISVLFVYICLCNSIVLLPIPHIEEPTSDLNCTFGLGAMSVSYALYRGFKAHGIKGYLAEMAGPMKILAPFFFLLHWVEEISRMISISFRLFGNIMGAAIVLTVVSTLSYGLVIPLGLYGFLFIFEAAVQGFVFAMLTLMYIASAVRHE